jgi:hypothetical protein
VGCKQPGLLGIKEKKVQSYILLCHHPARPDDPENKKGIGKRLSKQNHWHSLLTLNNWWMKRSASTSYCYTRQGLESLVDAAGFKNIAGQQVATCPYTIVRMQKP